MAALGIVQTKLVQLDQTNGSVTLTANASQATAQTITYPILTAGMVPSLQTAAITAGYVPYVDANGFMTGVTGFSYSAGALTVGSLVLSGTLTGVTTVTTSGAINGVTISSGAVSGVTTLGLTSATFASGAAVASDGAVWYDSTQLTNGSQIAGLKRMLNGCIFTSTANSGTVSNSGPTSLIGTGIGTLTLPSNFLVTGRTVRIELSGTISTGSATPTVNLFLKLGATTIATSGAKAVTISITTGIWRAVAYLTARAAPSGSSNVQGSFDFTANNATATPSIQIGQTTLTAAATNGSLAVDFQATTAAGTGTTSIVCTQAIVTVMN